MRTLIVEDDSSMRSFFSAILRARGHTVTDCESAEAALEHCTNTPFDLVLLDWMLGGMDGLTLCRKLRALPGGDAAVIVMITAKKESEDLQAVLDAGADDYLAKPITDPALLGVRVVIAEGMARNRAERLKAQSRLTEAMRKLEKSHDDLLSILNRLRVGTALTDASGLVIYLSSLARQLLGFKGGQGLHQHWTQAFPFGEETLSLLTELSQQPEKDREKLPTKIETPDGRRYWMEVEVQDDPRDPRSKLFLFYDVSEVHDLRTMLGQKSQFHQLVGKSEPMMQVYQLIRDVAAVDSTVLIEGDTGTGKELVARAIHFSSHRRDKAFIPVNCAGLTESLLTSQLFGHRRGAFTGAHQDHQGLFEAANGGTIFLDEIGDIPMHIQTALLRVLQEREITRVGDAKPRKIDVRVVAATHHNLARDVETGSFRADLLYRIRVARISLPPLSERREDIPMLTSDFLRQLRASTGKAVENVTQDALRALLDYHWPGNVRELRSALEYAVIRCKGPVIQLEDLPQELESTAPLYSPALLDGGPFTREKLEEALSRTRGNRAAAARLLGISRATFYRHLTRLEQEEALNSS